MDQTYKLQPLPDQQHIARLALVGGGVTVPASGYTSWKSFGPEEAEHVSRET
jgi:hypothetical protein